MVVNLCEVIEGKVCTKCNEWKVFDDYHFRKDSNKHRPECKVCWNSSKRKRSTEIIKDLPNEVWKDVPNYEGIYMVSNLGRVKSLTRKLTCSEGKVRNVFGKLISDIPNNRGYVQVRMHRDGKHSSVLVHRLVMMTFHPIENPKDYDVDHINHNYSDNRLENLRWLYPDMNRSTPYKKGGIVSRLQQELDEAKARIVELEKLLKEAS